MTEAIRPISAVLRDFQASIAVERVSLADILLAFHERGFGFLLFIFALPAAVPLPGLGINIIVALPLLFLTAQQAVGRHTIWLPNAWQSKSITKAQLDGILDKAIPYLQTLEIFVRPRLGFMTQGVFSLLIGVMGVIMTLAVCIPLPLTNTVPSLGIALMAMGVVMRDGLAVIAGACVGLLWIAMLTAAFIFAGTEGILFLKEMLKSLL